MKNKNTIGSEDFEKMLNHLFKLYNVVRSDRLIYGNAFIEFGERSLKVINPENITHSIKTNTKGKVYGKSPLSKK